MNIEEHLRQVVQTAEGRHEEFTVRARNAFRENGWTLPDDPEDFLSWVESELAAIPSNEPANMARAFIARTRHEYASASDAERRVLIWLVRENLANARTDRWVDGVERQFAHNAERRRQAAEPANKARWARWQAEADRIQRESSRTRSQRELAALVKRNLGLAASPETIRKKIGG